MKKRILLVVPRLNIGGAETYVATVARGLKERGYDVFTASGGGVLAKELSAQGIPHFFVPIRLNVSLAAWLLARIVRRCGIDIVHANSAAAGIAAVKLKSRFQNLRVVYTAHGLFGHTEKEKTIGQADKIIGVSEFATDFARRQGFGEEKLTTIYTGIDTEKFRPREAPAKLRESLGLSPDNFTVALVARMASLTYKGHEDMLEILRMAKGRSWQLAFIGKGRAMGRLWLRARKLGLQKSVHFLGHSDAVETILDIADVVALPSKVETFGLVLAEAMAMEKPVVTYAVGGTPEVLGENGQAGFLVAPGDRQEFYEKLAQLASDRALGARMGKAGRRRVEECFSCRRMLDALEKVYHEI